MTTSEIERAYAKHGVHLTKVSDKWRATCPFPSHKETKPSFYVYGDGSYHCFGCLAHGSLGQFVSYFGGELGDSYFYHLDKIDISKADFSNNKFVEDLKQEYEKKIKKVFNKKKSNKIFSFYDTLDKTFLEVKILGLKDKVGIIKYVRNQFKSAC